MNGDIFPFISTACKHYCLATSRSKAAARTSSALAALTSFSGPNCACFSNVVSLLNPDYGSNNTLGTASLLSQLIVPTCKPTALDYAYKASIESSSDTDYYTLVIPSRTRERRTS